MPAPRRPQQYASTNKSLSSVDSNHPQNTIASLLTDGPVVINVGLDQFATDLTDQAVQVVQVDWTPPAAGDPKLRSLLSKLGS